MSEEVESLEVFTKRLCCSLTKEFRGIHNRVFLYGAPISALQNLKENFIQTLGIEELNECPSFCLKESYDLRNLERGTYYVDVGWFLRIYENRKANGLNVILEDCESFKEKSSFLEER